MKRVLGRRSREAHGVHAEIREVVVDGGWGDGIGDEQGEVASAERGDPRRDLFQDGWETFRDVWSNGSCVCESGWARD